MIRVNDTEMYSLYDIQEECAAFRDEQTGRPVGKPVYFSSMKAMLNGAFAFAVFFAKVHNKGQVYGSTDPSVFYFDLSSGEMYFNGKDMLIPEDTAFDPEGAAVNEFLAPELILAGEGEGRWNLETDWYFMSVFLFEYFFHTGSPFEGKRMMNHCFLSPEEKEAFRAQEGVFCMEPGDHGNEPVRGIQDKLIRYWNEYPEVLKKLFQRAFLSGGQLTTFRPTELDWKQILVGMIMDYKICTCGFHGFSYRLKAEESGIRYCPDCGRVYYPLSDGLETILLSEGEMLYECQTGLNAFDYETVTAQVIENRKKKGLFGIRNMSDGVWRGLCPDGVTREIKEGQVMPIWEGMTLSFERGEDWTLRIGKERELYGDTDGC